MTCARCQGVDADVGAGVVVSVDVSVDAGALQPCTLALTHERA